MDKSTEILKSIHSTAPVRICDVGGWTDTHFAKFGNVFNIAVKPGIDVRIDVKAKGTTDRVVINNVNYSDRYELDLDNEGFQKNPLIEAAIKTAVIPEHAEIEIRIFSHVPPGASIGTSASLTVALTGVLGMLTNKKHEPQELVSIAHKLETEELGQESGIQDHIAAVYGGINFINMFKYPKFEIEKIDPPEGIKKELEDRLLLFFTGRPHNSSEIHKMVIEDLGNSPHKDPRLETLRKLAFQAKRALTNGNISELGEVFNENTAVQRKLHPGLICADFEKIINISRDHNAVGTKINGAGGEGGSVSILTDGDMEKKNDLTKYLINEGFYHLPFTLSEEGYRIW